MRQLVIGWLFIALGILLLIAGFHMLLAGK
jgi:hypothetical protein